ncbi:hypothetical protein [Scytonema sp. PCC 10023]|uniref:hypothetical protein n=1 Tax=Scytonema sp. PCC 10023 TaxID=1680591 RepID=UPI0039C5E99B
MRSVLAGLAVKNPSTRYPSQVHPGGEKLLIPDELAQALRQEALARQQAEEQAEQERQRAEQERQRAEQAELQVQQLKERLRSPTVRRRRSLGVNPDAID